MKKYLFILLILLIGLNLYLYLPRKKIEPSTITPIKAEVACNFSEQELLKEINLTRSNPILIASDLESLAHQRIIAVQTNFSHKGFKQSNDYLFPKYTYLAENLFSGLDNCNYKVIVNQWLNSPSHRETMIDSRYNYIGIAYSDGKTVAIFGDLR